MLKYRVQYRFRKSFLIGLTKKQAQTRLLKVGAIVEREAKVLVSRSGSQGARRSSPGEPPMFQTGGLINSIQHKLAKSVLAVLIGPSVDYGEWLEFGTRFMKARPFMRPALYNVVKRLTQVFERLF